MKPTSCAIWQQEVLILNMKWVKKMNDFDTFWKAYPRKVAKGAARTAWDRTKNIRPSLDILLEAIEKQKQQEQWQKDGGTYIPHPATWLRQERWDDEVIIDIAPKTSQTLAAIVDLQRLKICG
ncbi:MAG: hypothetical protein ACO306_04535 [Flavobacteriaceae bacterium]